MRLTTLARKVGRTPSQIINFLENNQIEIANGANTKLDESTIAMVLKEYEIELEKPVEPPVRFAEEPERIMEEVPVVVEEIAIEPLAEIEEPKTPPANKTVKMRAGTIDDLEAGDPSEIEHIKAKKVKLEGFKVVGKIELPPKPVKAPVTEEATSTLEDIKTEVPERSVKKQRSEYRKPDHRQNHERKSLSYEERLKKEEQARKREIQKKVEEDKARKQRYYEKHIAPKAPNKTPTKKTLNTDSTQTVSTPKVTYKNPLQRFWAWINGRYDRY